MQAFFGRLDVRFAAVWLWMGLIFLLSAQSTLPDFTPGLGDFQSVAGHLIAFGVLAWLWWRVLLAAGIRHPALAALAALALTVLYGLVDEFHQSFVPYRTPSMLDVATDAVGAIVVLAVASVGRRGD